MISIIIPTYNRSLLIEATLNSIIVQSYTNWECIIVDDGSDDETESLVKNYSQKDERVKLFSRPSSLVKGANSCRNYGLKKSKGDFIQFFDSDDIMHPDLLYSQMSVVQTSGISIAICNFTFFRKVETLSKSVPFNTLNGISNSELFQNFISGKTVLNMQTTLVKKEILKELRFDMNLHRAQDLDFMFRLLLLNMNQVNLNNSILVYIRRHEESITTSYKNHDIKAIESEVIVRKQIWETIVNNDFSKEINMGAFKVYLKAIKHILYTRKMKLFHKYMVYAFKRSDVNVKLKLSKLYSLALFYIFTNKGMTAYQRTINAL